MKQRVVVGMSGGVDSSVSAYLLKEQGFEVIGLFMRNWEECPAEKDFADVVAVCEQLQIPYYTVNFAQNYWDQVFEEFLEGLKKGLTPNPDVLCNREIKFKALFERALELGADYLATGHYCRIATREGKRWLQKGLDPNKDQSYFLYMIEGKVLDRVLFPVGDLEKGQVRQIAEEQNLTTAKKRDSTGICFIGKRKFKGFVSDYIAYQSGPLKSVEGRLLGTHDGCAFYTIGQRKGLGIGGPGDAWFVVDKDPATNTVFVAQGENHPSLFKSALWAHSATWITEPPLQIPFRCSAKIRYRQPDEPCKITILENGRCHVQFDSPQRAVTPQQSVVFYAGDLCLGGAFIES